MDRILSILQCATELFARKGFANTTIQEIADAAGVAAGTIIYHFKTKKNLLFIIIRGMLIDLIKHTESRVHQRNIPSEQIALYIESFYDYIKQNADKFILCIKSSPHLLFDYNTFPSADIYILLKKYSLIFSDIVSKGVTLNQFCNTPIDELVSLVIIMLFSSASAEVIYNNLPTLKNEILHMVQSRLSLSCQPATTT